MLCAFTVFLKVIFWYQIFPHWLIKGFESRRRYCLCHTMCQSIFFNAMAEVVDYKKEINSCKEETGGCNSETRYYIEEVLLKIVTDICWIPFVVRSLMLMAWYMHRMLIHSAFEDVADCYCAYFSVSLPLWCIVEDWIIARSYYMWLQISLVPLWMCFVESLSHGHIV